MSLKEDLEGVRSIPKARIRLTKLVSPEDLSMIGTEIRECAKFIRENEDPLKISWLESKDEIYSNIADIRVKALLSLGLKRDILAAKLGLTLLPEVPLKLLFRWNATYNVLNSNPSGAAEAFSENNLINAELILYFWKELPWDSYSNDGGQDSPAIHLIHTFLKDEKRDIISRLKLCATVKEISSKYNNPPFPPFLTQIEEKLFSKYKEEENLNNVPDNWILELIK
jgi:hypothetical protein